MFYRYQYLAILILIYSSCSPSKEQIIQDFTNHYTAIIESDSPDFADILSSDSNVYIDKMNNADGSSFAEILDLGRTYKIPYLTVLYFTQLKNSNQKSDTDTFLKFLYSNSINLFSFYDVYGISEDNTKIGNENFIAIFRNLNGQNKLDWVRMTHEEDQYKIDLLYILEHAEHRILKDFKDTILNDFGGDTNQYLEDFFNRDGRTILGVDEFKTLLTKHRDNFSVGVIVK